MPFLTNPYRFGFTPASIAGLCLWLDADDAATVFESTDTSDPAEAGDTLGLWLDKSGQGNHVGQSSSTLRPIWTSAGLNSRNIVTFDGSNDRMVKDAASGLTNAATYTWYFVLIQEVHSGNDDAICVQDSGGVDIFRMRAVPGSSNIAWLGNYNTSGAVSSTRNIGTANTAYVRKATNDGSNQRWYYSGTNDTDAATGGTITGTGDIQFVIGDGDTSAGNWDGSFAEVLYWNTLLTNDQQTAVEAYILAKWGI